MKKKILALCLVVVLAITAVTGATLAYFTDTDEITNTFTSGNVQITQNEKDRNGNDYGTDAKKLLPIVHDDKVNGYHMGENYIDKFVTVTNNGSEAAFIRTHLAIPAALENLNDTTATTNILHWNGASASDTVAAAKQGGDIDNDWYWGKSTAADWPTKAEDWNMYQATIGDVQYNVYVATHATAVEAGTTTAPNLMGLYIDKDVDYNGEKYTIKGTAFDFDLAKTKVLVFSEAVQAEGFDDADADVAFKALNEAFGTPGATGYVAPWNKPA